MQLHELKPNHPLKARKPRVGRSGKRGTTSGKGQKGQKARAGRRMRPAERDFYMRLPKLRGIKNRPTSPKLDVINVGDLERLAREGVLNAAILGKVMKILGDGEVKKPITIEGLPVSGSAKQKIEAAGGQVKPLATSH